MTTLKKACEIIVKKLMGIKKKESVLIVFDKNKTKLAHTLYETAKYYCDICELTEIPIGKAHGEEPPKEAANEMKKFDVILMLTTKSLTHTKARIEACKKGARIASMPNITEDMMKRTMTADYDKIAKISEKLILILNEGTQATIRTKAGTNLTMNIDKRKKISKEGFILKKGQFSNLPGGEADISPQEGSAHGHLVIDASVGGIGKVDKKIKIYIEDGIAKKIEGGESAKKLKRLLSRYKKEYEDKPFSVAELGIGTNPKAKVTGNVLEDEKSAGTAHIAFGNNLSYGGKIDVPLHIDCVFKNPSIIVDGKLILRNGKIIVK